MTSTSAMSDPPACYSSRFVAALSFAAETHASQRRKGRVALPYVTHLFAVCTLVWTYDGDEDQAIAALLHDAVEDGGGAPVLERIRRLFGDRVAGIVDAATDSDSIDPTVKAEWRPRKKAHVAHAGTVDADAALVMACDKLHNLTATVADLAVQGEHVFGNFKGGAEVKFRTSCGLLCGLRERVEQWVDDFLREPFAG